MTPRRLLSLLIVLALFAGMYLGTWLTPPCLCHCKVTLPRLII